MFNLNKTPEFKNFSDKELEIQNQANHVNDEANDTLNNVSNKGKSYANELGDTLENKVNETKLDVKNVINSLKTLISQYTDSAKVSELKDQIIDKATGLKGAVQNEMTHAYRTGKDRTVQTVREKPVSSMMMVLGVGLLIGYILSTKKSSK